MQSTSGISIDNRNAFLTMIAYSLGTKQNVKSTNGYNALYDGTIFAKYKDHPRKSFKVVGSPATLTTAAGRYFITAAVYDAHKKSIGTSDFTPASQDSIALHRFISVNALVDIDTSNPTAAIAKCATLWPTLVTTPIATLLSWYAQAGGH